MFCGHINKGLNYTIDLLDIPELILKLYVFIQVISLTTCNMLPGLAKGMERTTNLSIIFL